MTQEKIHDVIERALELILLGSQPRKTNDLLMDQVLDLYYRLHFHILILNDSNNQDYNNVFSVILSETMRLFDEFSHDTVTITNDSKLNQLPRIILTNILGICHFYLNQPKQSFDYLSDTNRNIDSKGLTRIFLRFKRLLDLEKFYYLSKLQKNTSSTNNNDGIFNDIPLRTDSMSLFYFNRILLDYPLKVSTNNLISVYNGVLNTTIKESQLLEVGHSIIKNIEFPQANQSNDHKLELFFEILGDFFEKTDNITKGKDWEAFFIAGYEKTFHSISISYAATIFYGKFTDTGTNTIHDGKKRSELSFVNFLTYNKKYYELNERKYLDIVAIINLYKFVLGNTTIFSKEETKRKYSLQLYDLLCDFYEYYNLELITAATTHQEDEVGELKLRSEYIVLPVLLSLILISSWRSLYFIFFNDVDSFISKTLLAYLGNAISVSSAIESNLDLYFEYAYCLARQQCTTSSIKFLKTKILNKYPEHSYSSWHLLCLLESVQENKENSFKIACSVLEAMKEEQNKLTYRDKWQFMQLKLTQLSLVHEMFGVKDALEMLPEVFELYSSLFNDDHSKHSIKHSKEYLLQYIWLFTANLYIKDGSVQDAKEAVKESEAVEGADFKNLNHNIAKGYLKKSLDEFEACFYHDPVNTEALIGFAELAFETVEDAKCDNSLIANLYLRLETCIKKSIAGYISPEIWWYLSKIYEKYDDPLSYENALWNCVKFEEERPIRELDFCKY
ncbi:Ypp1p SCDLUD_004685 [Saccharomycodes ludwigii]|uniref:Ypp1p n=1 Tax=Saccharomycodes ludwigii TaxID=36035 RepID=UPI001E8C5AC0|nr:hypothetical protein SCDLUD_004685 [Saccharomycodes ludwigii]KAH3899251.1 hypothetical protein SCDLUD_004685 [Saccharomycodes ludwigii]